MYLICDGELYFNTHINIDLIMLIKNINNIDGVKLDVRKTIDNIYVLSKYNNLNKLTYSNHKVNESKYHYLRKVKFKSHIFKYFIPTLEEVLLKYPNNKIIVLELYSLGNEELYYLLKKYPYNYYFISRSNEIINELKKYHFDDIGVIIDNYDELIIKRNVNKNTFILNVN